MEAYHKTHQPHIKVGKDSEEEEIHWDTQQLNTTISATAKSHTPTMQTLASTNQSWESLRLRDSIAQITEDMAR